MSQEQVLQHRQEKQHLFEYFVVQLERWKEMVSTSTGRPFSKLQLQKLLFLISAYNATTECHPMLDFFFFFYALKYGPVEMDIYDAMAQDSFEALSFGDRFCDIHTDNLAFFDTIPIAQKTMVDNAIGELKERYPKYILKEPFELVDITHGWTAWQIAMLIADMSNSRMERMSTTDICNSTHKLF